MKNDKEYIIKMKKKLTEKNAFNISNGMFYL